MGDTIKVQQKWQRSKQNTRAHNPSPW